jgi:hypothetical protein
MSRIGETTASRPPADVFQGQVDGARAHSELLRGLDGKQACPFCGSVSERSASACARCGMENTPEARKATKARIGPWYVLQARNPAAPGMRFETLLSFVRKGRVRARSVVRGPTTHQLWRFAAHVKGLSREFGLCFSCGSAIDTSANICPQCNRLQEPPVNPDVLLESEGDDARAPVYRELPSPPAAQQPAVPVPAAAPEPEEVDIVIPALGGFGLEEQPEAAKFSESPVAAQAQDTLSLPAPTQAPPPKPIREPSPLPRVAVSSPFTIGGANRRKQAHESSSFLSAKELAAAFKLSFDPSADMEQVDVPDQMPVSALPDGMRPQAIMPRGPMAMSQMTAPPEPGRRRSAFKKVVLFLLILAGTGFGILLWVDPTFRDRSIQWTKTTWSRVHRYATGADVRPSAATTEPTTADEIPDPPAIIKSPPPGEAESKQPAPAEAREPSPAPDTPRERPVPAPDVEPKGPQPVAKNPEPTPAPVVDASDDEGNSKKANQLWQKAWDSVRAGDYPSAVKAYQEIQKLPRKYWPGDLETKLKLWGGLKKK